MRARQHQLRLVLKQRHIANTVAGLRVCGDHQIEITLQQRRQRIEVKTAHQIQLHIGPAIAIALDGRHQPFETTVALDRDVQATGPTSAHLLEIALRRCDLWQDFISQTQHALTRGGESHRLGLAEKQRAANPLLKVLELMRQRRLGDEQPVGGLHQTAGVAQGNQGAQMAQLKVNRTHEKPAG